MDMSNCAKCGKIFNRGSLPICDDCQKIEEDNFQKVRLFLDEYPDSTLDEVAIATDVSAKKILKYLKDGRLEASTGIKLDSKCSQCGRPISKGRFCDKCVIAINQDVSTMFEKKKKGTGMHTFRDR